MRKFRWIALVGCVCWLWLALAGMATAENLVRNGSFEEADGNSPAHWSTGMWLNGEGISYLDREGDGYDGEACAYVENVSPNDARWEQEVSVKPDTLYRISAMIKAEDCDPEAKGANISVGGVFNTSPDAHDTKGEWVPVAFYGLTGPEQNSITLMARLGGYGSEATGIAWFDAVSVEEVSKEEEIPADAVYMQLYSEAQRGGDDGGDSDAGDAETGTTPSAGTRVWLSLLGVVFAALACLVYRWMSREGAANLTVKPAQHRKTLWGMLGVALVVRLLLAWVSPGYPNDVACFYGWSNHMANVGPTRFYADATVWCDYPPGYMYALWINGGLLKLFGMPSMSSGLSRVILRMFPMLLDVAGAYFLYRFAQKRDMRPKAALLLAGLYAFNPITIVTSAAWGQVDAALCLGLAVCLYMAVEHKWRWALPLYAACVLVKPQALMMGPLGLLALVMDFLCSKDGRKTLWRETGIGMAAAVAVLLVGVVPFWGNQPANWLLDKYVGTMASYDFATLSTTNLFYLMGGNWVKVAEPALFGINWTLLGWTLMAAVIVFVALMYIRARKTQNDPGYLFLAGAVLLIGLFMLGHMMHERYLLPAIILLGLAYVKTRDVRVFISWIGFSAVGMINIGMVLVFQHLIAPNVGFGKMLSVANLLLFAVLIWAAWDLATGKVRAHLWKPAAKQDAEGKKQPLPPYNRAADGLRTPKDARLHLSWRDWLVMSAITVAYSVLAFTNLGDTIAPQTQWRPSLPGEQVVFDLGEPRDFVMYYYAGIITDKQAFTVALSDDNENWTQDWNAPMTEGDCFSWQTFLYPQLNAEGEQQHYSDGRAMWLNQPRQVTVRDDLGNLTMRNAPGEMTGQMHGRYVRITGGGPGLVLGEVGFRAVGQAEEDGSVIDPGPVLPIVGVQAFHARVNRAIDPAMLTDEQNTVPIRPGFMNSTYFDEIYHARTGYEHEHNIHTFEWTHPPLGKVLIMFAIRVFGMTPFGWRFMGTLVGILMLPALYMLAKQLWKRTDAALFVTLLMALDCMHFTQTRIATIDSYPVLFIILMYWLMIRYTQMSFYHQPLYKTLIPLAVSGFFMGCAIASKWIGMYAAVGLACMLFFTLYQRWQERNYAHRQIAVCSATDAKRYREVVQGFPRQLTITLAWCVLWFMVVPGLMYYFSFYWWLKPDGGLNWARFWQAQVNMFAYHSGQRDTHSFMSSWWSWPVIGKPMYYYSSTAIRGLSSVIWALGNPAVWWTGGVALLGTLSMVLVRVGRRAQAWATSMPVPPERDDQRAWYTAAGLLVIGFASQYLPWMLVARSTYIYHYFASIPFIILCIAQCLQLFGEKYKKQVYLAAGVLLGIAFLLFIGFYPFASGAPMTAAWGNAMRWFDNWIWF